MLRTGLRASLLLCVLAGVLSPSAADACRTAEIAFTPSADLQIVVWLEDAQGNFIDTLFITQATGIYGLGNRPGIMEFNSEFLWPYGRRESLFPVWAHRHGVTYPKLIFQDEQDRDLSHEFRRSSPEPFFCRPLITGEPAQKRSVDTGTCATVAYTDKGKFAKPDAGVSFYPPRRDVSYTAGTDSPDVQMFATVNDLDAVSRATPPGGMLYQQSFSIPASVTDGNYVVFVEVGKEFDQNAAYNYPSPVLQAYGDYGDAYRGQPSVVWGVPIAIDGQQHVATALDYDGYGDPDGVDGTLRVPDATISTGTEGSGAQRLLVTAGPSGMYRVQVTTVPSQDSGAPGAPTSMSVEPETAASAKISFLEPEGDVKGYDVRLSAGEPITADNFSSIGTLLSNDLQPAGAGTLQTVEVENLLPQTHYWIAIRAHGSCLNGGTPTVVDLVTPKLENGEVSACFIATAAFGSPMQAEVSLLRSFRDQILRRQALGEIFVETYYTFGPAIAGVIRPSDTLRAVTRAALEPVVERARSLVR